MKTNRTFHHNRLINIATGIVAYGTTAFIGTCLIAIVLHMIEHGAPTSFGIYGQNFANIVRLVLDNIYESKNNNIMKKLKLNEIPKDLLNEFLNNKKKYESVFKEIEILKTK